MTKDNYLIEVIQSNQQLCNYSWKLEVFLINADTHRAFNHTRNHHLRWIYTENHSECEALTVHSNICLLVWMYKSMEPEEAVKHSSSPTFLLRFGRSGGSGHGRSPSGSVPPAWWGHWSAPDTGDSWQSAAPTCVVSSPASTEAQVRKWTWTLVSPPFALLCLFLKAADIRSAGARPTLHISLRSREQRHENKHRDSTGILDRMLWMLIKKTACQRNPVKVC